MNKQAAIGGVIVLFVSAMPFAAFAGGALPAVPSAAAATGQAAAAVQALSTTTAPAAALPAMPVTGAAAVSADHAINRETTGLPGLDGLNESATPSAGVNAIQPIRGPGGMPLQLPVPLNGTPSAAAVERRS
jgi:hypothetical protein